MFAVPAVSTALASDATRPGVPVTVFSAGDEVAAGPVLPSPGIRPPSEPAAGLADGTPRDGNPRDGNGNGSDALGVGTAADALADGLGVGVCDSVGVGVGVGVGELGMQMRPRMHP
jgi:hypothetical protein